MAKVGNEVKLILSLAEEKIGLHPSMSIETDLPIRAYCQAIKDYQDILKAIVSELEGR